MTKSCEDLLDLLIEVGGEQWSINATKEFLSKSLHDSYTPVNYKLEEYSSAVFKRLWTKELDFPFNGQGNASVYSNGFNDEVPQNVRFKAGQFSGNHELNQLGGHIWHDTGDAHGNVYDYYTRSIDVFKNSTIPGLLATALTGGTSVCMLSTWENKHALNFVNEDVDNENNSLNAGVYIVHIRDKSNLTVKESILNGKDMYLNKWIYIIGYDSKLELTREVINSNGVVDDVSIIQYPGSELIVNTYDKDPQWRHLDITAYQNTTTTVNGSVLCKNSSSSHNVIVNHKGNNSTSTIKYHSAIYNNNVTDFIGSINVDKKAVGTNSSMINKNLLMDKTSKAKSIPKLNINTKEIQCTHGCTISNVDENEIYYLETLGVSKTNARKMIADGHIQI
jgi:hypothetical protein